MGNTATCHCQLKNMDQFKLNSKIEAFIRQKDSNNEGYSKEDIVFINQYEGSGGQGSKGAKGEGVLYEFYTPDLVCELMYKLALHYGYDGGAILEPSIGTGRVIKFFSDKSKVVGFEINETSARIAEINYPKATIHKGYFETAFLNPPRFTSRVPTGRLTWLEQYPFSLVIGNPPYGKYKNMYSSYFRKPKMAQIEMFFMYYGLQLLKQGGLLIYLTSSNFLRNGITYNPEKKEMERVAEMLDAYRLPPVFKSSKVPVDIIIFKRK
jgi:type I restriction-modification system DNA methylase subunit